MYPLSISVEVLRLCGSYEASNLVVGDVREVLGQERSINQKKKKVTNMKVIDLI